MNDFDQQPPPDSAGSLAEFTDRDLDQALRGSLIAILVMFAVAVPFVWMWGGWQTAALFAVGAAIAAMGIWEWKSLVAAINERLDADPTRKPRPIFRVLLRFSLRLVLVAAALYVSLRCLHGSAYALVAGLGLAVIAVSFQAARLLRRWM